MKRRPYPAYIQPEHKPISISISAFRLPISTLHPTPLIVPIVPIKTPIFPTNEIQSSLIPSQPTNHLRHQPFKRPRQKPSWTPTSTPTPPHPPQHMIFYLPNLVPSSLPKRSNTHVSKTRAFSDTKIKIKAQPNIQILGRHKYSRDDPRTALPPATNEAV